MSPLTDTSNSSVNWPFIYQGAINHRPHSETPTDLFVFREAVKLELERFAGWFENVQICGNKSDLLLTAVWATRNLIAVRLVAQRVIIANQAKARETMPWSPRHLVTCWCHSIFFVPLRDNQSFPKLYLCQRHKETETKISRHKPPKEVFIGFSSFFPAKRDK